MIYTVLCPLLPLKQIGKLIVNIVPKKLRLNAVLKAFPFILLFSILWSLGELIGLLAGDAGYRIAVTEE
jgi:hypothetical protein